MDVWAWLEPIQQELAESGHEHVSRMIDELPYLVQNSDPRSEAVAPELIAAARALGNPWLEVYARHWRMQHQIGNNNHGTTALRYATESLEFAHRPDTLECPQSICVTQDLSMAFESVDCFGHAADREAVCRETLTRIDARWNCYDCLHRELCDAVADQGRPQEAMDIATASIRELEAVDDEPSPGYVPVMARLHSDLGNPQAARDLCEKAEEESDGDEPSTIVQSRNLEWARACRLTGDFEAAIEHLPSIDDILVERTLSACWSKEVFALVEADVMENDFELGVSLQKLLDYSDHVGSLRTTVIVAEVHARLASRRGIRWLADAALTVGERARVQLPQDHGAMEQLAAARSEAEAVEPLPLPVDIAMIPSYVETSETSLEQDIQWLQQAVQADPNNELAAAYLGNAYGRAGHASLLTELLGSASHTDVAGRPGMLTIAMALLNSDLPREVVNQHVNEVSARLIGDASTAKQFVGYRIAAEQASRQDNWPLCVEHCQSALQRDNDAPGTRRLLASASMEMKDFATAATQLTVLADAEEEPGGDTWDLLTAATCLGDWATVRNRATRLGMDIDEGVGPIDETWSQCRVLLPAMEGLGAWTAIRTGPVTARVVEVSHPTMPIQHFGSVVALNPSPVNLHEKEEHGDDWMAVFPAAHVLVPSQHNAWVLDGVYPGIDEWSALRDDLRADGWGAWVATWNGYEITDSETDETHEGIFAFVASPPNVTPSEVNHRIVELTTTWPHQLAFRDLAEAAKADVAAHDARIERYGL
jgi:tetratricopeptide (TPR) repeat protein